MIKLCVNYIKGNAHEAVVANIQLPTLKRWARKEGTQHEYHKSINKVLDYIQNNLAEKFDLQTLSQIANMSSFHFHRIFKTTIGEKLGEYVQRLRLEYVAEQLKLNQLNLSELAVKTGYSSEQALSRAFKKKFNLPPKVFAVSFYALDAELAPRICKISEKNIVFFKDSQFDWQNNWRKLYFYTIMHKLVSESSESLGIVQNNLIVPCITTTSNDIINNNTMTTKVLKSGLYAIFTHKGLESDMLGQFQQKCHEWLSLSKYTIESKDCYIKFLNNSMEVDSENLLSEFYIPVK